MYSLWRNDSVREQIKSNARVLFMSQALSMLPALLVTQIFFHWKSFLLEFAGFLATWFVIDFVLSKVISLVRAALTE